MIKDYKQINEESYYKSYNVDSYKRPSITNDILVITVENKNDSYAKKRTSDKGLQVLLVRRSNHPNKGKLAIPGGFIKMDESLEDSVLRILKEKTGISNLYTEQLYTFGDINRDKRTRVISIANLALVEKNKVILDDNLSSAWFWVDKKLLSHKRDINMIEEKYLLEITSEDNKDIIKCEVTESSSMDISSKKKKSYKFLESSSEELSFDHFKILDYCIDRLRNKLEYTTIAFNLLPEIFTVKELQNVYEAILGHRILNFRRKIGKMIIETQQKTVGVPYRPAKLFKFNKEWQHDF